MDGSTSHVRTRPGAILVTMVVAILTLVAPSGVSAAATWSQRRVADDPPVTMTTDDRGHVHVVTEDGAGLRYMTNATGRWTGTRITRFGSQPSIALSAGTVYVVYARIGDCPADEQGCRTDPNMGLYLATNRSGTWTTERLSGTAPAYWPSLRMRDGKLHIAYNHLTGIRHLTNRTGFWADQQVWSTRTPLTSTARTSIALDSGANPYIAFMRTSCDGMAPFGQCRGQTKLGGVYLTTRIDGRWMANGASQPTEERAVLDRVVIDPAGKPVVGYTYRLASGALRFRVTRFDEMDALSSRTLPGTGAGSFTLDASGRIEVVRWADGRLTWRAERTTGWLSRSWSTPRIKVAWVRSQDGVTTIVRDGFAASVPAFSTWVLARSVPTAPTAAWGPMALAKARDADLADTGVAGGSLVIGERCVIIRFASGANSARATLVFREGQVRWDAKRERIRFHDADRGWIWLEDGDRLGTMGGWDPWADTGPGPGVPGWVVRPNPACPVDRILVHQIDRR